MYTVRLKRVREEAWRVTTQVATLEEDAVVLCQQLSQVTIEKERAITKLEKTKGYIYDIRDLPSLHLAALTCYPT